ncbi:ATP-binding protein [Flavobacterium sp.]|uniref:PAS domain-containing sensor histidine kinase n=1 Tax=Flavobacterium sp. TaxID=239 RepID=UPI0026285302|nr:ATP-binding protein [Flavobacterium sp.]
MFTETYTEILLETSRDAILIMERDFTITKANRNFYANFKCVSDQIQGKSFFEINGKAWDKDDIHKLFEKVIPKEKHAEDHETLLTFPESTGDRCLVLNVHQTDADEKNPALIFLFIEDITEKRHAEAQLIENERRFTQRKQELEQSRSFLNSVLNSTYYGIASYEPLRNAFGEIEDFRITYTNQEVPGNFGLSVQDVVGKTFKEVYPGVFENGIFEKVKNCLITGIPNTYEISVADRNHELWLTAAMEKVNDTVTITSKNITAEKEAALQLERMNTLLFNKNKELSSFTYIASHDLQEPLRKIRMFISRILEEEKNFSDNTLAYFTNINSTAVRMQMLIDALLSYSSMESGIIKTERTDLNKFVKEVLALIDISVGESGAVFEIGTLPTVQVVRIQFQQLLLNVINNAIKYRKPETAPKIKIAAEKVENNNLKFWKITIEDDGIGFDQQYAEKIFEVFQRLHGKKDYEGTGVGLAICKKIMLNHHGDIVAEGIPGVGAKFHIYIPTKG